MGSQMHLWMWVPLPCLVCGMGNKIYLFPYLSPSYHPSPPPPPLGLDGPEIFLDYQHHHPDLLMTDFLPGSETIFGMAVSNKAKITNQEVNGLNGHHFGPTSMIQKKKDRRRKIYTAQGLRDRRVRLSIEISRKFFDLQDILGFEKPSKTIDWLLTHSKTAIKDLMNNKVKNSSRSGVKSTWSSTTECEVVSGTHEGTNTTECEVVSGTHEGTYYNGVISKRKEIKSVSRGKKVKQQGRASFDHLRSREARARARERARERTREKSMRSDLKTSPNFQ